MAETFPLQLVPVLDLLAGQVVRGVAGNRAAYRPIQSNLADGAEPGVIAQALVQSFAAHTLYIADLDAIQHDLPQWDAYRTIAKTGARLWIDAGTGTSCAFAKLELFLNQQGIAADIVVGLESLATETDLDDLLPRIDPQRLIFSVDLQQGRLLTSVPTWDELGPLDLTLHLVRLGIRRFILLDLVAVGVGQGVPTLDLAREIRRACPQADLQLIGGGGVRSVEDLGTLAEAGFNAALVASALHDGRISPPL